MSTFSYHIIATKTCLINLSIYLLYLPTYMLLNIDYRKTYKLVFILIGVAKMIKTREISVVQNNSTFSSIFDKIRGKKESDISALRQLLSNEKARMLHILKVKEPSSIYKLAKILKRDFKAVRHDIKILQKFGFVELVVSHKSGRERLKPVLDADKIIITINLN